MISAVSLHIVRALFPALWQLVRCRTGGAICAPWQTALPQLRVVVVLGAYAWENAARELGVRPRPRFAHGLEVETERGPIVLCSYHPSQRNTFTGLLTEEMLANIFTRAAQLAE